MRPLALFYTLFIFFSSPIFAQQNFKPVVSASANLSTHGSGDMTGMLFNFGITQSLRPRLSIRYDLGFTLHGSDDRYLFDGFPVSDPPVDAPYWTTAGIQFTPRLLFNFTGKGFTGLKIGAAPVLRFQMNSYPLSYAVYGPRPPQIRQTYLVILETDRNHFNAGYSFSLQYDFRLAKRSALGIGFAFQNDTNEDLITSFGLTYAHMF